MTSNFSISRFYQTAGLILPKCQIMPCFDSGKAIYFGKNSHQSPRMESLECTNILFTRNSSGDEVSDRDIARLRLVRLTPRQRGFPGTISVKFCTEVKGWLRYKMAKKYCRKFQPLSRAQQRCTRQTHDRRICDIKDPNVT